MSPPDAPTSPRRRGLLRLAVGGAFLSATAGAQSQGELRLLLAAETEQHAALVRALRARWPFVATYGDLDTAARGRRAPVAHVAIGPRAFQQALRSASDTPLIAVLVSRQASEQLIAQSARPRRGVTAVFAEASPGQQMRTIAAIMRRPVTVGVFTSDRSRDLEPALRAAAQGAGLTADVQAFEPEIGMSRNLLRLGSADALLIFPDSHFTPTSLRELLESTYRRRQPVFGFSEAVVGAGTLASAFAGPDDLAAHVVELLGPASEGRLPAPQYPKYWRVAINDSVARSLDIVIDGPARSLGVRP